MSKVSKMCKYDLLFQNFNYHNFLLELLSKLNGWNKTRPLLVTSAVDSSETLSSDKWTKSKIVSVTYLDKHFQGENDEENIHADINDTTLLKPQIEY